MPAINTNLNLSPELTTEIFSKVKGFSSLAALCGTDPIPFNGIDEMTFSLDQEAELVGEGDNKSPGNATFEPVTIKPFKLVYQHRLTDEFVRMTDEKRLPYLRAFGDGFSKKIARGVDITAFHGVNPRTNTNAASIRPKCFDVLVTNTVTYAAATPDDNLDDAIALLDGVNVTGIVMAPTFSAAMAKVKVQGVTQYPEFRFGGRPASFAGNTLSINNTVSFGSAPDHAIVGDFQGAFKWGYCEQIPMEIIQYGDPDGQGDLKRKNQIVLRAEAYIGFGILDPAAFARVITSE